LARGTNNRVRKNKRGSFFVAGFRPLVSLVNQYQI
jgi:hypothetical protein